MKRIVDQQRLGINYTLGVRFEKCNDKLASRRICMNCILKENDSETHFICKGSL